MNKNILIGLGILVLIVGGVFLYLSGNGQGAQTSLVSVDQLEPKDKMVVHKSDSCSCCLGHASYLEDQGYEVEVVIDDNLNDIKNKYKIPYDKQSCHTLEVAGYFVEGHVPIEAIEKLLAEKPEIDGISLPDMPAGSPGMPGAKTEEFIIYAIKDGVSEEFMRI